MANTSRTAYARARDIAYIPAGVPHLPVNLSDRPASAVIARMDPNEQESVVLLPDLEQFAESGARKKLKKNPRGVGTPRR